MHERLAGPGSKFPAGLPGKYLLKAVDSAWRVMLTIKNEGSRKENNEK
jgi:hypothetical protein